MITDKIDLQQIRKSVLRSQLLALESQAQAIYYLGTEHREGIDLGRNPEIYLVVQDVKDIAQTAKATVDEAKNLSGEEILSRLQGLQTVAQSVVERAEEAYRHMAADADRRLEEHLKVPEAPEDRHHLKARAYMSCHSAETDQHLTFKIQVRAICDLALELAFTAAAESGHDYPRDAKYWD